MSAPDPLRAGLGSAVEILSIAVALIALGYANRMGWLPW